MKYLNCILFLLISFNFFSQSTISAPNGTYSRVISTEIVYEPNALMCGFNDLSLPIPAQFKVETILYEKFEKGVLVNKWTEKKKTYIGCYEI